jgi:uncharacterized Zn finger protein
MGGHGFADPREIGESAIRQGCSAQSFIRGGEFYRSGVIINTSRKGDILYGECEGTSEKYYQIRVVVGQGKILSASCSCEHQWGGYCKHIVALALTYIHEPEKFDERRAVLDFLSHLSRAELVALIANLVDRDPNLIDRLEALALPAPLTTGDEGHRSTTAIRRRIQTLLHNLDYLDRGNIYAAINEVIHELEDISNDARELLEAQEVQSAQAILVYMLETLAEEYDRILDEGEMAAFIKDLEFLLAETILSAPLIDVELQELFESLSSIHTELAGYDIQGVGLALAATCYGWSETIQVEVNSACESTAVEWSEHLEALNHARLSVLKRQNRLNEYLELSNQTGKYELHTHMLLEMGRIDEGFQYAVANFTTAAEAYAIAQKLMELGDIPKALALGEHGLDLDSPKYDLGYWLGDLEETHNRHGAALNAYLVAFYEAPSLELYQFIKNLSQDRWDQLQPDLLTNLHTTDRIEAWIDILLYEGQWDDAILCINQQHEKEYRLIEKVIDVVALHRPDWAIRACQNQVEVLIAKRQTRLYAAAVHWLEKLKQVYLLHDRKDEWEHYIDSLRKQYSRHPTLNEHIKYL